MKSKLVILFLLLGIIWSSVLGSPDPQLTTKYDSLHALLIKHKPDEGFQKDIANEVNKQLKWIDDMAETAPSRAIAATFQLTSLLHGREMAIYQEKNKPFSLAVNDFESRISTILQKTLAKPDRLKTDFSQTNSAENLGPTHHRDLLNSLQLIGSIRSVSPTKFGFICHAYQYLLESSNHLTNKLPCGMVAAIDIRRIEIETFKLQTESTSVSFKLEDVWRFLKHNPKDEKQAMDELRMNTARYMIQKYHAQKIISPAERLATNCLNVLYALLEFPDTDPIAFRKRIDDLGYEDSIYYMSVQDKYCKNLHEQLLKRCAGQLPPSAVFEFKELHIPLDYIHTHDDENPAGFLEFSKSYDLMAYIKPKIFDLIHSIQTEPSAEGKIFDQFDKLFTLAKDIPFGCHNNIIEQMFLLPLHHIDWLNNIKATNLYKIDKWLSTLCTRRKVDTRRLQNTDLSQSVFDNILKIVKNDLKTLLRVVQDAPLRNKVRIFTKWLMITCNIRFNTEGRDLTNKLYFEDVASICADLFPLLKEDDATLSDTVFFTELISFFNNYRFIIVHNRFLNDHPVHKILSAETKGDGPIQLLGYLLFANIWGEATSDAMNEKTLFKIIQLDEKFSESPMKKANYLIRQSIYIEKRKFIQYFAEEIIGTATRKGSTITLNWIRQCVDFFHELDDRLKIDCDDEHRFDDKHRTLYTRVKVSILNVIFGCLNQLKKRDDIDMKLLQEMVKTVKKENSDYFEQSFKPLPLWFYYQNVANIGLDRMEKFAQGIKEHNPPIDFVIMTETFFTDDKNHAIKDGIFPAHNIFTRHRDLTISGEKGGGGGVAIIHEKHHLIANVRNMTESVTVKQTLLDDLLVGAESGPSNIYVNAVYIPPQPEAVPSYYPLMEQIEQNAKSFKRLRGYYNLDGKDHFVSVGDFNFPMVISDHWNNYYQENLELNDITATSFDSKKTKIARAFIEKMKQKDVNLHQNSFVKNDRERTLDLVLSNQVFEIQKMTSGPAMTTMDHHHPPLKFALKARRYQRENKLVKRINGEDEPPYVPPYDPQPPPPEAAKSPEDSSAPGTPKDSMQFNLPIRTSSTGTLKKTSTKRASAGLAASQSSEPSSPLVAEPSEITPKSTTTKRGSKGLATDTATAPRKTSTKRGSAGLTAGQSSEPSTQSEAEPSSSTPKPTTTTKRGSRGLATDTTTTTPKKTTTKRASAGLAAGHAPDPSSPLATKSSSTPKTTATKRASAGLAASQSSDPSTPSATKPSSSASKPTTVKRGSKGAAGEQAGSASTPSKGSQKARKKKQDTESEFDEDEDDDYNPDSE